MKTKLFSFVLLILLSTHLAIAQISDKVKMSVEILGGVNLQNINWKDHNGDKLENDPLTGFHAGIKLNIPVAHNFYFQPGLLFSVKGANDNFSVPNGAEGVYKTNTRLSYFEIPFNLLYRPKSGIGHILLGIGPYIAYGTGGKEKSEIGTLTYERKVKYKSKVTDMIDLFENAYYRPFDACANIFF